MNHLVVVAAGTGGHVMPGIAVAEALRGRGWSVSWLGTQAGMERGLVERHGIAFDAIDFSGLRGKGLKTLLLGGFALLRALWQSRAVMRRRHPGVVFSTGGYVAVPAGMAASRLGVPLVLLNPDAAPLMSTRMLKSLASGVLCYATLGMLSENQILTSGKMAITQKDLEAEMAGAPFGRGNRLEALDGHAAAEELRRRIRPEGFIEVAPRPAALPPRGS